MGIVDLWDKDKQPEKVKEAMEKNSVFLQNLSTQICEECGKHSCECPLIETPTPASFISKGGIV